jgi:hypothetical protein
MAQHDERTFDVRLIDNRLRRGAVTAEEYKAHLDSLPDDSVEGVETDTTFVPTFASRHHR